MSLFQNRSYKLVFSATAVSNLGDGVSALAFPWLATLITRDPVLIALVAFATRLPWFLMSIPAGAIAGGIVVALGEVPLGRDLALQMPYLLGALILSGVAVYGWKILDL